MDIAPRKAYVILWVICEDKTLLTRSVLSSAPYASLVEFTE